MIEELRIREQDHDNKTEVVAAYHELLDKLKETKKLQPVVVDPVKEEEKKAITSIVKETKEAPDKSLQHFESLKRELNIAIEDIKEKYLAEQKKLSHLLQGIEFKTTELAELHDIKANVDTLSALLLAQNEKKKAFEKEMNEKRQQFSQEMTQERGEFMQEMTQKRSEWRHEEQTYTHQRDLAREKERNRYEMAKRSLEQELTTMRLKAQKELDEREARITASEQELQQLEQYKDKVSQFPEELRRAVQKAEDMITRQLTTEYEYKAQLWQKEVELHKQKITALETEVSMLKKEISHFESLRSSVNRLLFNSTEFNSDSSSG